MGIRWKPNPGLREKPRDPTKRVYVRFMNGLTYPTNRQGSPEATPAGNWNWKHRGFDHDIKEAGEDDGK